jgi:palmitoyltransferase|tara:strand:+ start:4000 stop:5301 length:1302 start_codon:yes stop_codon:yes gene_type:complete
MDEQQRFGETTTSPERRGPRHHREKSSSSSSSSSSLSTYGTTETPPPPQKRPLPRGGGGGGGHILEGKKTTDVEEKGRITRVEIKKPSTTTTTTTMKPSTPKRRASGVGGDAPKKWVEPDEGAFTNVFASNACRLLRAFGSVMVLIVLGIIGLTYYATVGLVYGPLSEEGTEDEKKVAQTVLVTYHVMIFMILWSYFAIVLAEPGSVPERWEPPEEDPEVAANIPKSESKRRVCKKCVAWKPERTHHCSVCQRCVLRMDHHCVWVANCVGARNYKFFLQFLVYTFIGTTFDAICLLSDFVQFFKDVEESESAGSTSPQERDELRQHGGAMTVVFVAFVMNVAFAASLLGFIVMHGNLVLANMTTIEMYEKKKTLPWKYDKGRWENFKEIFGDNVFSWLLPFHTKRASEKIDRTAGLTEGHIALKGEYCRPIVP